MDIKKEELKKVYVRPQCNIIQVDCNIIAASISSAEAEDMEETQGSWGR